MSAHREEGVFHIPIHPPEQGSSSQPSPSFLLAEGPKQVVFKELIFTTGAECEDPFPDLCSLLPEPSEPIGLPAALEAAPQEERLPFFATGHAWCRATVTPSGNVW